MVSNMFIMAVGQVTPAQQEHNVIFMKTKAKRKEQENADQSKYRRKTRREKKWSGGWRERIVTLPPIMSQQSSAEVCSET